MVAAADQGGGEENRGSLSGRVLSLERGFTRLESSVDRMSADLGAKIDRQASKPTNLLQLGSFVVALFVAFGGFAFYAKSGIDNDVARVERNLTQETKERNHDNEKIVATIWSKDAQAEYEKGEEKVRALQHEYAVRDLNRVEVQIGAAEAHIATVDAYVIKRPEIEALLGSLKSQVSDATTSAAERLGALSVRINEVAHEFGANFTQGDAIKDLQNQVRELRQSAPAAITPLAPVSPK